MNLVHNASEAIGDRDGVIRVTSGRVIVGRDSLVATSEPLAKGDYVKLEVSDTGRGMTPEVQARIFEPFFTTKLAGHHGLGLAMVQGIVEHLDGAIQLLSAPGKGTAFQIFLPSEQPDCGYPQHDRARRRRNVRSSGGHYLSCGR